MGDRAVGPAYRHRGRGQGNHRGGNKGRSRGRARPRVHTQTSRGHFSLERVVIIIQQRYVPESPSVVPCSSSRLLNPAQLHARCLASGVQCGTVELLDMQGTVRAHKD
jgi:hypothetical protein